VATQTRTQTQTRTYAYTRTQVYAVALAVAEDLDELITRCGVDLAKSMGGLTKGDLAESNHRLCEKLKDDFFYLLKRNLVKRIVFVFHGSYDATLGGYLMSYEARYEVRPGEGRGSDSGRIRHVPLALPTRSATDTFKIVVEWSDVFLNRFTEGERQSALTNLSFQWIPPQHNLLRDGLGMEQKTAEYYSGTYGVARIERSRMI
jgi:hypothetical protein